MMARINSQEAIDHFIGFVVSASIAALLVILAIWRREPWINRVRLPTLIPLAVSASVPAQLHVNLKSFFNRAWRDSEALARVRDAYDALALAGIILTVWVFLSTLFLWFMKLRYARDIERQNIINNKALNRKRSSGYFYVFLCDLIPMSIIILGLVRAGREIPWTFGSCSAEKYLRSDFITVIRIASGDAGNEGACKRAVGIQLASTLSLFLMLLHHILLYPVMTLPTPIRLIIFFSIRLFIRSARPTLGDVEFGDLPSTATEKNAEITNEINILSHLEEATNTNKNTSTHYTDMLHSVRSMPGFGLPSHFDFLAERYCGGKEKTKYECWACGNVVCETCKTKLSVPTPRTTQHFTDCYVLCTKCYLLKAPSQPVHLSAAAQRRKLSIKTSSVKEVDLCKDCAAREPEQIRDIREKRERALLAKSLRRSIPCARCEKPLTQNKRQWWMCGAAGSETKHDHYECHWIGHEGVKK